MGEGLRVLSHLKGTTDEKIDAIARDVNVELNQGVNNLDAKADNLVKNVKAETAEMRKIIESAEFGIPAPSLASMNAVSDEAGINVTVTATDATVDYSSDKAVLATTKGVMVRYKDGSYPANKEDGELAFIDDDLFTVDTNGSRVAKAKTHLVVGLTKNHVYFFSAFPYTQQGAHNERLGTGNVAKTRWVGNTATLTVNIAKDYDIFDLGEVTVTLRNDSTSETHTQKRTGVGNVVFNGIVAGNYTVSFAGANADCNNPDSQSITLTGGIPSRIDAIFKAKIGTLEQTSWAKISRVSKAGVASQFFSVGDTKNITVNGETLTMEIVGFNHDNLTGGGKAGITFGMKHLMAEKRKMNSSNTNSGGWTGSQLCSWLTSTCYNGLPSELRSVIRPVIKKTSEGNENANIIANQMSIFLFSEIEVLGKTTYSYTGEGTQYARFTTTSTRIKKLNNGSGRASWWWLRSPYSVDTSSFCNVNSDGSAGNSNASDSNGVCFGFCV